MRVTIVFIDKVVIVDGIVKIFDTLENPNNYHALQWYGNRGELEFPLDENWNKPQNKNINNLNEFKSILDKHAELVAADKVEE